MAVYDFVRLCMICVSLCTTLLVLYLYIVFFMKIDSCQWFCFDYLYCCVWVCFMCVWFGMMLYDFCMCFILFCLIWYYCEWFCDILYDCVWLCFMCVWLCIMCLWLFKVLYDVVRLCIIVNDCEWFLKWYYITIVRFVYDVLCCFMIV